MPLTILCASVCGVGHINATIGFADALKRRGHRVVFALDHTWAGKLKALGYEEELYHERPEEQRAKVANEAFSNIIKSLIPAFKLTPLESFIEIFSTSKEFRNYEYVDKQLEPIVSRVKPDIIIQDNSPTPCLYNYGVPWVLLCTTNPLMLPYKPESLPPGFIGLPTSDRSGWEEVRRATQKVFGESIAVAVKYAESKGVPMSSRTGWYALSKNLNLYVYPEELDYTDLRPLEDDLFFRMDAVIRKEPDSFEVPESLKDKPGKLIYFSLGSLGSIDMDLMKKLTAFLSHSPNRFIVSKGMSHDKYELPENMWGARYVPQTKVLPLVDLFITHGGNNSFTEAFHFGVPMIVLPLFGDQHDNAQRLVEKGLGLGQKFHPYHVTQEELLEAVDHLLHKSDIPQKMKVISEKIQSRNTADEAATRIESLVMK